MKHRVHITDMALVCGLGEGVDTVWSALLAGQSAIRPVGHFSTENYISNLAALVPRLDGVAGQSRLYPLLERLLVTLAPLPEQTLLLTATTKGAIDVLEQDYRRQGAEGCGAGAVPAAMTRWLAHRLNLHDGGMNINAACASSTLAIARAAALIAHGRAEVVLVCCADLVTEFVFSGFSALQALSPTASRPFDCQRDGLTLGEGAAALVLMSDAAARRYQRPALATVRGWGAANDANHITAPARDGCGLIQTIEQTLKCAQLSAAQVSAISAHGTGTVYNDMMELVAFRAIFGERRLPMSSVKGALGHTLGAAGGIEAVLAVKSLDSQRVPPTCGFEEPELYAAGQLSGGVQPFAGDFLLSTNSGFGGVNAAILLQGGAR